MTIQNFDDVARCSAVAILRDNACVVLQQQVTNRRVRVVNGKSEAGRVFASSCSGGATPTIFPGFFFPISRRFFSNGLAPRALHPGG